MVGKSYTVLYTTVNESRMMTYARQVIIDLMMFETLQALCRENISRKQRIISNDLSLIISPICY